MASGKKAASGGKWLFIFNRIMYEGVLYVPSGPCSKLVLLVTGRIRSNFIRAHDAVIITFSRFSRGSSVGQCTRALPRIFLCRTGPINRRKYLHGDHHRWPHQRNCRIRFNGESTLTQLYLFKADLWNQIENQPKNLQNFVWTLKMPIYHLGLTKAGHPKHPLYLSYAQQPEVWSTKKPHQEPEIKRLKQP